MLTYFQEYYLSMARGISYVPTQVATVVGVVMLMTETQWTMKGVAKKLLECVIALAVYVAATAAAYLLLAVVSVMITASQIAYFVLAGTDEMYDVDSNYKAYNQIISLILLIIQMLTYYLYYSVVSATRENLNLLTMQHKAAMEKEKFEANRINYDDLRMLRHELKNHNFYMLSLLEAGKYKDLAEYLYKLTDDEAKRLQSFDCGNYLVDVVMNHAMHVAEEKKVTVMPQIIVPRKLPYEDTDFCSLLSNLMDNAIEAAEQANTDDKSVTISILPRQDYPLNS